MQYNFNALINFVLLLILYAKTDCVCMHIRTRYKNQKQATWSMESFHVIIISTCFHVQSCGEKDNPQCTGIHLIPSLLQFRSKCTSKVMLNVTNIHKCKSKINTNWKNSTQAVPYLNRTPVMSIKINCFQEGLQNFKPIKMFKMY